MGNHGNKANNKFENLKNIEELFKVLESFNELLCQKEIIEDF